MTTVSFRRTVYNYYREHGRSLPWRKTKDPYKILISEIMLQQTQVPRVTEKYNLFIKTFPNFKSLATAPLREVLGVWQGLGYNRRALMLHRLSLIVVTKHKGVLPESIEELDSLPGIGYATASSIRAFAFNKPAHFIETNIRSVYIHFFFRRKKTVSDPEILKLVEKTADNKNPREWYWALMDYGTMLKATQRNPSRKSLHYAKQALFKGSNRQTRGQVVRLLLHKPKWNLKELAAQGKLTLAQTDNVLRQLEREGFIRKNKDEIRIV